MVMEHKRRQYYCLVLCDNPHITSVFSLPTLPLDRRQPGKIYDDLDDTLTYAQQDLRHYVEGSLALSKLPPISAYDNPPELPLGEIPRTTYLPCTVGYRRNMMIYPQRFFWLIGHMHRFGDLETMTTAEFLEEVVHAEAYTQRLIDDTGLVPSLPHPYIHPEII